MNVSKRVEKLHPYVPGEQPKDRVYIKLNANENPYPPSKNVAKNVIKFIKNNPEKMGLYPDPDSVKLNEAIAKVSKALPSRDVSPVLECIKVTAENDKMTLFATDKDLAIEKTIDANVIVSGAFLAGWQIGPVKINSFPFTFVVTTIS